MIILSRNECPFPPSDTVSLKIREYVHSLNRYEVPELSESLITKLSNYVGVDRKYIHLIPGSEAFFVYLREYMLLERLSFVFSSPTFIPAYEDLSIVGVNTYDIPLTKGFKLDFPRLKTFGDKGKALYIVNPNNPTGNQVIKCKQLPELLQRYRLVILDEAYFEFSSLTCKNLLRDYPSLIILRTFSKAFCLAGARIGYFLAHPELTKEIMRTARKYDISILSLAAALGALESIDYMNHIVEEIKRIKEYVVEELSRIKDVHVVNTLCNFILLKKKGYLSNMLSNELMKYGIMVMPLKGRLNEYVRVSIGTESDMREFLLAIKKIR